MTPSKKNIFLKLQIFSYHLDGHENAQKVLKTHRDAQPNNPTIIRLQFEMALKVKTNDNTFWFSFVNSELFL